jgi:hypothetical protein
VKRRGWFQERRSNTKARSNTRDIKIGKGRLTTCSKPWGTNSCTSATAQSCTASDRVVGVLVLEPFHMSVASLVTLFLLPQSTYVMMLFEVGKELHWQL